MTNKRIIKFAKQIEKFKIKNKVNYFTIYAIKLFLIF